MLARSLCHTSPLQVLRCPSAVARFWAWTPSLDRAPRWLSATSLVSRSSSLGSALTSVSESRRGARCRSQRRGLHRPCGLVVLPVVALRCLPLLVCHLPLALPREKGTPASLRVESSRFTSRSSSGSGWRELVEAGLSIPSSERGRRCPFSAVAVSFSSSRAAACRLGSRGRRAASRFSSVSACLQARPCRSRAK